MAPQIVIHATLYIDPVHMPEYLKELRKVIVEVTKEIECTMFEVLSKPDEPSVVRLVEAWAATMEWLMGVSLPSARPPTRGLFTLSSSFPHPYFTKVSLLYSRPSTQSYSRPKSEIHFNATMIIMSSTGPE